MKALSKKDAGRKAELVGEIQDKATELSTAVAKFNDELAKLREDLTATVTEYNEVVQTAEEFRADMLSQMQSYFDEKSERWQEGEAGQAYQQWINDWEGGALTQIDLELPDDISEPSDEASAELEGLADDPE
jgi:DNA anti-recombination protein RmuC